MLRFHKLTIILMAVFLAVAFAGVAIAAGADLYYCPMHPQVTSDKTGECPICHMRLVKRGNEKEHGISDGVVSVSDFGRKVLGVRTEPVAIRKMNAELNAWGIAAHDPELYELQVEYLRSGSLNIDREKFRSPLAQKRTLTELEKADIRLSDLGLGEDWIQALREAGKPDRRLLFHHDAGGAWVYVRLHESDARRVQKGMQVSVRMLSAPETSHNGRVEFIDGIVDLAARTVLVRILLEEFPQGFTPNTSLEVQFHLNYGEKLAIPESAVLFTGEKTITYVEKHEGFELREILLGQKAGAYYEVKSGVESGERVALDGNFFIDSESRLKTALSAAPHEEHAS